MISFRQNFSLICEIVVHNVEKSNVVILWTYFNEGDLRYCNKSTFELCLF